MSKLTYFKIYIEDYQILKEFGLTFEEIGILLNATMEYLENGKIIEVPERVKWPFASYRLKIDNSIKSYDKKCQTNAKNGAKGGKQKAANAAAKKNAENQLEKPGKKKRYTKTEFKNIVSNLRKNEDCEIDDTEALELYEQLDDAGWTYEGKPITKVTSLKRLIYWYFCNEPINRFFNRRSFRWFWNQDIEGEVSDFWDEYDEDSQGWNIDGTFYSNKKMEEAMQAFLASSSDSSEQ